MSTEQDRDQEQAAAGSTGSTDAGTPDQGQAQGHWPPDVAEDDALELEDRAMLAAERALQAGQQALEAAEAAGAFAPPRSRARERVLRGLLVFNLLLMAAVLLLPQSGPPAGPSRDAVDEVSEPPARGERQPAGDGQARRVEQQTTPGRQDAGATPVTRIPETDDRYARAMLRAAAGDIAGAVEDLERYLAAEPDMPVAMQRNVLGALAHYSFKLGFEQRARDFERRAAALTQSHYLPEDLVKMARRAEEEGDGERMRRLYARFLLQQKQVPPSMHKFLAEAYLKLGDSYRIEATRGAELSEAGRARELQPVTPENEPAGSPKSGRQEK